MPGRKPPLQIVKLLLTCEHAGNEVPEELKNLFNNSKKILRSHRGYDPGAKDLFIHLQELADRSFFHSTSRLVIEINRSQNHPSLFSEFTRPLSRPQKEELINNYYYPYRKEVEEELQSFLSGKEKVLHLSVHSFTPELNGDIRKADIGLLYDPSRSAEKVFCSNFKKKLLQFSPHLNIRYNYPYLGKADGFTTYLRKKFPENYLGIEIEVNQRFAVGNEKEEMHAEIKAAIYKALEDVLK